MRACFFASVILLVAALALGLLPTSTAGEDGGALVVRVVPVGGLVLGRWNYIRAAEPPVSPDQVSNAGRPLFGAVGEEPVLALGTIDELIELIQNAVNPRFWEEHEGASIQSIGRRLLLVRATPGVQQDVAAYLDRLQARIGATVTIQVATVRVEPDQARALLGGDPEASPSAATSEGWLAGPTAGPAVSLTAFTGQQATAFAGRQIAWIGNVDVEVAQDASTSDPIVQVSNVGLLVQARALPGRAGGAVLVGIDAALVGPPKMRPVPTRVNGTIQARVGPVLRVHAVVRVPADRWVVVDGAAGGDDAAWLFLVRATPHPFSTRAGAATGVDLTAPAASKRAAPVLRTFDVRDLGATVRPMAWSMPDLWPSNYTAPPGPELEDPEAAIVVEDLADLLRSVGSDALWEDPARMDVWNGRLRARNAPAVLDAVGKNLDGLTERLLWTLVVEARLEEVPQTLGLVLGDAGVLDERRAGLLQAARVQGEARLIDALRLTSMRGTRNAVRAGRSMHYLQDYEVEIAQGTTIGNPVFQDLFDGAQLDVEAARSPGGGAVQLNVEFARTDLDLPLPTMGTEHGDIELPRLEVLRFRTGVEVPLGQTVVVGSWAQEGRRRLLLLT
ncbi:MAG: hypothetical protein ACC662_08440, partial [Planctomycetota bacterium]